MCLKMNMKTIFLSFSTDFQYKTPIHMFRIHFVKDVPCWIPHLFCISILWCHVLCLWSSCSERRRDWMIQKHWWQCCSDVTFQREFHLNPNDLQLGRKKREISVKDLPKVTTSENYLSNVAAPLVAALHCKVWQVSPGCRMPQRQLSRRQGWRRII